MEPTFRFTRESRIRIDPDGHVWHEGERIEHKGLAEGLASWVVFDRETGRYMMRNAMDWCFITVDDTPLVVRTVEVSGDAVTVQLSDGRTEALDLAKVYVDPEGAVFAYVRGGELVARFSRNAAFTFLSEVTESDEGSALWRGSLKLRPLDAGARLPPTFEGVVSGAS